MKQILYLIILAFACMMLWYLEIFIRGLEALRWLNDPLYSFWIIPIILHIWGIRINGKFQFLKHIVGYPILYFFYFLFLCVAIDIFRDGFAPIFSKYHHATTPNYIFCPIFLSPIILFPVITFIGNLMVAKMENKRLNKKNKLFLLFSPFLIPVVSAIFTILLFAISPLFPPTPPEHLPSDLEIKSGSLFFSCIVYEGIYYLWIKEKLQIPSKLFNFSSRELH